MTPAEQRIERLTAMARRAWPRREDVLVIDSSGVDGSAQVVCRSAFAPQTFDGTPGERPYTTFVRIPASESGVLGIDALEVTLRVLLREPSPMSELDRGCIESMKHNVRRTRKNARATLERAVKAEAEVKALRAKLRSLDSNQPSHQGDA